MTEAEAHNLQVVIERDWPHLTCDVRPRIHTGRDAAAHDVDDEWALIVTNASTGVVVNVTSGDNWREQIEPVLASI